MHLSTVPIARIIAIYAECRLSCDFASARIVHRSSPISTCTVSMSLAGLHVAKGDVNFRGATSMSQLGQTRRPEGASMTSSLPLKTDIPDVRRQ